MAIHKLGVIHPRLEFAGVDIFTTLFCGILLAPDMLERQSRSLKTRMIV